MVAKRDRPYIHFGALRGVDLALLRPELRSLVVARSTERLGQRAVMEDAG